MLCGDLNGKETQKREDVCIYQAGSLCCAAETNKHRKATILKTNKQTCKIKDVSAYRVNKALYVKVSQSCLMLCNPTDTLHGILQARILEWVAIPQGIFLTHESNPSLLHSRRVLYQLSHQGKSRISEWVTYPFSSGSSSPRD